MARQTSEGEDKFSSSEVCLANCLFTIYLLLRFVRPIFWSKKILFFWGLSGKFFDQKNYLLLRFVWQMFLSKNSLLLRFVWQIFLSKKDLFFWGLSGNFFYQKTSLLLRFVWQIFLSKKFSSSQVFLVIFVWRGCMGPWGGEAWMMDDDCKIWCLPTPLTPSPLPSTAPGLLAAQCWGWGQGRG